MLEHWAAVLIYAAVAFAIPGSLLFATFAFANRAPWRAGDKSIPFESGVSSQTFVASRFTISYYLTAMLFIVFDIEIVFLYPWAVHFDSLRAFGLVEMVLFIATVFVAYAYVWRRGGLDWD